MTEHTAFTVLAIAYAIGYIVWQHREVQRYEKTANALSKIIHGVADGELELNRGADGIIVAKEKGR